MNRDENGKLIGDCARDLPVELQSEVPGSVGLLTRLTLITNLLKLFYLQKK
jgi:5,10-methylene-tetrahydrofolate dehydrogenase/methenyl tetrahydrofolate cyclohydrolase